MVSSNPSKLSVLEPILALKSLREYNVTCGISSVAFIIHPEQRL